MTAGELRQLPECIGPCRPYEDGTWDCAAAGGFMFAFTYDLGYDPAPWQADHPVWGIKECRQIASWPMLAECPDCMVCMQRLAAVPDAAGAAS